MSRKGSGAVVPPVGSKVRHPLWPELGVGEVETVGKYGHRPDRSDRAGASLVAGRVRWSCGQVSHHNLSVLREVDA